MIKVFRLIHLVRAQNFLILTIPDVIPTFEITVLALHSLTTEAVAQRCSMKKDVLRNFAKFTGKHLCQSLFFNKVAGLRPAVNTSGGCFSNQTLLPTL